MNYKKEIQEVIDYIEANLCEKLKLSDLAERCHLSEFYFHRLFRKETGETVMEYVRKRRLTKAAEDLLETQFSILDIAVKYEFSCGEAFSRAFKKMYGITPIEYRNSKSKLALYKKIDIIGTKYGSTLMKMAA